MLLSFFFVIICIVKDNIQHLSFKHKYCIEQQHNVVVKTRVFWLDRCDFELAGLLPAAARVEAAGGEQQLSGCESTLAATSCVTLRNLLKMFEPLSILKGIIVFSPMHFFKG